MMYGVTMNVPDYVMDKDFVLPLNKAKIEKEGTDVTIVAFSSDLLIEIQLLSQLRRQTELSQLRRAGLSTVLVLRLLAS